MSSDSETACCLEGQEQLHAEELRPQSSTCSTSLPRKLAACAALSSALLLTWALSSRHRTNSSEAHGDGIVELSILRDTKFFRHAGYLDTSGHLLTEAMTVDQAKGKCMELPHCAGFSYAGRPTNMGDTSVEVDFSANQVVRGRDSGWTSYTLDAAGKDSDVVTTTVVSPYTVVECAESESAAGETIHPDKLAALLQANFSQCVVAAGALVAATEDIDPNTMLFAANILGELLDANCDGEADDPSVVAPFSAWSHMGYSAVLTLGSTLEEEEPEFSTWSIVAVHSGAYLFEQGWSWTNVRSVIAEQAFHLVHRHGWSIAYPAQFGFPSAWNASIDENSHACECMKEAQCVWYQHPRNQGCKDASGQFCVNPLEPDDYTDDSVVNGTCREDVEGACAGPECDCLEFVHKVFVAYAGDVPVQGEIYTHLLEPSVPENLPEGFADSYGGQASPTHVGRGEGPLPGPPADRVPEAGPPPPDLGARRLGAAPGRALEASIVNNLVRTPMCTTFLRDMQNASLSFPKAAITHRAQSRVCLSR